MKNIISIVLLLSSGVALSQSITKISKDTVKIKNLAVKPSERSFLRFDLNEKNQIILEQNQRQNIFHPVNNYSNSQQHSISPTNFILSGLIKYVPAIKVKL